MCTGPHPYIPVGGVAEVELIYSTPGGRAENTLYFRSPTGWTLGELQTLVNNIQTWQASEISPLQSSAVSLVIIKATDLTTETGSVYEDSLLIPQAGGNGSAVMPSNVTGAISFLTENRGRSFRGRNYVIGLADDQVAGDTIATGVVTAYEEAYETLHSFLDDPTWRQVVVSRCFEGEWRTSGLATLVISYRMDHTVDSQRRRLAGRGI